MLVGISESIVVILMAKNLLGILKSLLGNGCYMKLSNITSQSKISIFNLMVAVALCLI
jgi:hypothetical protein